jgi:thymidylate synthase
MIGDIIPPDERQYLALIKTIVQNGQYEYRNNTPALGIFGYTMRFSLKDGIFPIMTTSKIIYTKCLNKLHICAFDKGIVAEKLAQVITRLNSRDKCNVADLCITTSGLLDPPGDILQSHTTIQFRITGNNNQLSCAICQTQADAATEVPFNIAVYSLLLHIVASHCGLIPIEIVYFIGNIYVQEAHLVPLMQQTMRNIIPYPTIYINRRQYLTEYSIIDIQYIRKYVFYPSVKLI